MPVLTLKRDILILKAEAPYYYELTTLEDAMFLVRVTLHPFYFKCEKRIVRLFVLSPDYSLSPYSAKYQNLM